MKRISILLLFIISFSKVFSQQDIRTSETRFWRSVSIGKGDATSTATEAWLEIGKPYTTRGLIIPRVDLINITKTQGNLVYNIPDSSVYFATEHNWVKIRPYDSSAMLANYVNLAGNGLVKYGHVIKIKDTSNGPGNKLMWLFSKGAFRVGNTTGMQWDYDSIGLNSFSFGIDNLVKGRNAFSIGTSNLIVAGTGLGQISNSFSLGSKDTILVNQGVIVGHSDKVIASRSSLFGHNLIGNTVNGIVVGNYNDTTNYIPSNSPYLNSPTDRAFTVGIGYDSLGSIIHTITRTDGFRVLFSGQIQLPKYGIGTFTGTPAKYLAVTSTGDVIEAPSLTENIFTNDGTISAATTRKVNVNLKTLLFDSVGLVRIQRQEPKYGFVYDFNQSLDLFNYDSTLTTGIFANSGTKLELYYKDQNNLDTSSSIILKNNIELASLSYVSINSKTSLGNNASPNSTVQVQGSFSTPYVSKSANYTATDLDYTIDCLTGSFTITLPTAVGIVGRIYEVVNSGTGVITVTANGAELINGLSSQNISIQGELLRVKSTNTGWIIVN